MTDDTLPALNKPDTRLEDARRFLELAIHNIGLRLKAGEKKA